MRPTFYLEFDDPSGTDRLFYATFRQHLAWSKRVKKGRVLLLANTKTRQVFAKSKVIEVYTGKAWQLCRDFGHLSHLEEPMMRGLSKASEEEHKEKAAKRRFAAMQKRYGPHRIDETSNMTVLILSRAK